MKDLEARKAAALFKINKWGYQDPEDNNHVKFHSCSWTDAGDWVEENYGLLRCLLSPAPTDAEVEEAVEAARTIFTQSWNVRNSSDRDARVFIEPAEDLPLNYGHIETLIRAAKQRHGVEVVTGWQPIETAPEDGVFMVYTKSKMWYVAVRTCKNYDLKHLYPFHTYTNCHPIGDATHWQPLPPPPSIVKIVRGE